MEHLPLFLPELLSKYLKMEKGKLERAQTASAVRELAKQVTARSAGVRAFFSSEQLDFFPVVCREMSYL